MADEKGETLVEKRWKEGQEDTRAAVRHFWENFSFWGGHQWVTWQETENTIRKLAPNPKRSRATRNRIRRSVRVNLGKLLKNELQFDVSPNSADDAAVKGAQLAMTVLENARVTQNWENVRSDEVFQTMMGGTAAVCVEWDPVGYRKLGDTEEGKPMGEGDTCLTALSIREFVVEPGVKDAELAHWWIKATAENPQDVADRWPKSFPKGPPEPDAQSALSGFQQRVMGTNGDESSARSVKGRVMVLTMFERPCKAYPQGRVETVVDGKVVESVPWPYRNRDRLNLFVFRDMKSDGWVGESMINDAVPVQLEINLARSIFLEHLKKVGNARLGIPDGSMDEEDLSDDPAEPFFYNAVGNQGPSWVAPPGLPQWEINYPEQAAAEMDDILGVHDISRGEVPSGVESGAALALLAERDDSPLSVFSRDQAEVWGRIGTFVLECYAQFVKTSRDVTVRPKNEPGQPVLRPYKEGFTGEMLHGQTEATVPLEVTAPTSRAVMQARADAMLQMGVFGTPPDMRAYARVADLPNRSMILAALNADADKAQRVCERMFRGETVTPMPFDNFGVHIAEVNVQRKSERYDRAPAEIQQLFDLYVQACETMAAEQAGQQEMRAMESANLAGAPQGNEPPGSVVPPPVNTPPGQAPLPTPLGPPPLPEDIAALAPQPEPEQSPSGSAS